MCRPNDCIVPEGGKRPRFACTICNQHRRKCSLVPVGRANCTPSAAPSTSRRSSSRPRTPVQKLQTPVSLARPSSAKKTSRSLGSRSTSRAEQSRVSNTKSRNIVCFFLNDKCVNIFFKAAPKITIPPFKRLVSSSGPNDTGDKVQPAISLMQRDIQMLENQLSKTERLLDRLMNGIKEQLQQDINAVPPWLLALIVPADQDLNVPRVDAESGHTIGRVIYSPISQMPKKIVSTHIVKGEEEEHILQSKHFVY